MAKATIKIDGLASLQKRLDRMGTDMIQDIKNQVQDSTGQIYYEAVRDAPNQLLMINGKSQGAVDVGARIDNQAVNNGFGGEVTVQGSNEIPIFIEFGTGTDAASYVPTLPQEVQEAARKFYKNGQGTIAKQPYLIPAFLKESPIFVAELKKILKKNV
jgi:multidrug efflux pump subunit AcrA (membrane-fusion protein)